jgi:hypothetical protein
MNNGFVFGMGVFLLFAGDCLGQEFVSPVPVVPDRASAVASVKSGSGDEYLLKIEEVEGPAPQVEQSAIPGAPSRKFGWVKAGQNSPNSVRVAKSIEFLVSINSPFHLKITDCGDGVELHGRMTKSVIVPARPMHRDARGQQPPQAVVEQDEDFRVQVEYSHFKKDGQWAGMKSSVPIRFGKKYLMAESFPFPIPQTLWSIETVKPASANSPPWRPFPPAGSIETVKPASAKK